MEETKGKEKTYITKYKGLELVHTPMGIKDAHGNKVPSVRCAFHPTTYGYAFSTSNVELIKWLDRHEYALDGRIQAFTPSLATKVEPVAVAKGITSGMKEDLKPTAPAEKKNEAHTVKIRK